MPISASVSSRWSSTCVAVVGSLTAGDSARIATSTRIAQRERGILVDRALGRRARPCATGCARASASGATPPCTCTSGAPRETKSPTACGSTSTQSCSRRPARRARPRRSPGSRPARRAARDERDGPLGERPDLVVVRLPSRRRRDRGDAAHRVAARLRDQRRHRHRPQPVDGAVEEDEEEHDRGGEEEAARGDAEVRDVVRILDAAQQREREGERPDQHGEHGLERAVAVPEPHVARRERPRRHLHDEHADRDHEAGQRRPSRRRSS